MDEKIFNPKEPWIDRRRYEWVQLDAGRVCVRELTAADSLFVMQQSTRPAMAGRAAQMDNSQAMLWQIQASCYNGHEESSQLIFDITDLPVIQRLRQSEWGKLVAAIERVNALADEEVERLEDFTRAPAVNSFAP